jgi:hypothetical protein
MRRVAAGGPPQLFEPQLPGAPPIVIRHNEERGFARLEPCGPWFERPRKCAPPQYEAGAVVLANPGQVRLDRQALRLRHRSGGIGGSAARDGLERSRPASAWSPRWGAVICAWAQVPAAANINVAVSIDLMTSLGTIEERAIKHICLVGNNRRRVQ